MDLIADHNTDHHWDFMSKNRLDFGFITQEDSKYYLMHLSNIFRFYFANPALKRKNFTEWGCLTSFCLVSSEEIDIL